MGYRPQHFFYQCITSFQIDNIVIEIMNVYSSVNKDKVVVVMYDALFGQLFVPPLLCSPFACFYILHHHFYLQ